MRGLSALILAGFIAASCSSSGTRVPAPSTTTRPATPSTVTTSSPSTQPTTTTTQVVPAVTQPQASGLVVGVAYRSDVPSGCVIGGNLGAPLPDSRCTPGTLNPDVSQATIATTICVPGYSTSIRPPSSFTSSLKRAQMASWGITGSTSETEEDHLVPLSLGGAPSDSKNLWPEAGSIPNAKDRLEYRLYRMVCDGQVPLVTAQEAIATNWIAAYQRWIGPLPS